MRVLRLVGTNNVKNGLEVAGPGADRYCMHMHELADEMLVVRETKLSKIYDLAGSAAGIAGMSAAPSSHFQDGSLLFSISWLNS